MILIRITFFTTSIIIECLCFYFLYPWSLKYGSLWIWISGMASGILSATFLSCWVTAECALTIIHLFRKYEGDGEK